MPGGFCQPYAMFHDGAWFSALWFFISTFLISSYVFLQCGVKPFVMGKGAEAISVALLAIPCQWQQPQMHDVIQYKYGCIQKICARCCSESSAFCLWNLRELLVHYISFLNSLQVFYHPPPPRNICHSGLLYSVLLYVKCRMLILYLAKHA